MAFTIGGFGVILYVLLISKMFYELYKATTDD